MAKFDAVALNQMAHEAGHAAAMATTPVPMIVIDGNKQHVIDDGVCGFASIRFPANTKFAREMRQVGLAQLAYPKGLMVDVGDYNQSLERKRAYARAYAEVLRSHGIDARVESRMD